MFKWSLNSHSRCFSNHISYSKMMFTTILLFFFLIMHWSILSFSSLSNQSVIFTMSTGYVFPHGCLRNEKLLAAADKVK